MIQLEELEKLEVDVVRELNMIVDETRDAFRIETNLWILDSIARLRAELVRGQENVAP